MADPDEDVGGAAPVKKEKKRAEVVVEEKIDPVLHVDRTVAPAHPEWLKTLLHPELELKGPSEYDMKTGLVLSFIKGQETGTFTGLDVYNHLKTENLLDGCLGIADGYAICERGAKAYSKFFEAKESSIIALWSSVFTDEEGKLCVPLAIPVRGKIVITKGDLNNAWTKYRPLVRFGAPEPEK